mgnify:CR=1 FL=1
MINNMFNFEVLHSTVYNHQLLNHFCYVHNLSHMPTHTLISLLQLIFMAICLNLLILSLFTYHTHSLLFRRYRSPFLTFVANTHTHTLYQDQITFVQSPPHPPQS